MAWEKSTKLFLSSSLLIRKRLSCKETHDSACDTEMPDIERYRKGQEELFKAMTAELAVFRQAEAERATVQAKYEQAQERTEELEKELLRARIQCGLVELRLKTMESHVRTFRELILRSILRMLG